MDMRDFMGFTGFVCALVLIAAIAGFAVVAVIGYGIDAPACGRYGRLSGQNTYYSIGTGCLVKRDGEWVDYDVAVGKKLEITTKVK